MKIRLYKKSDLDLLAIAHGSKHFRSDIAKILQDYAKGVHYVLPSGSLPDMEKLPDMRQFYLSISSEDLFYELYQSVPKLQRNYFIKNIIRHYFDINMLDVYCNNKNTLNKTKASSIAKSPEKQNKTKNKQKATVNKEPKVMEKEEVSVVSEQENDTLLNPAPKANETLSENTEFDMFSALAGMMDEY